MYYERENFTNTLIYFVIIVIVLPTNYHLSYILVVTEECSIDKEGYRSYSGNVDTTEDGRPCLPWSNVLLQAQGQYQDQYQDQNQYQDLINELVQHNYCRNIDHDVGGAWCFTVTASLTNQSDYQHDTKGGGLPWGYCKVKNCGKNIFYSFPNISS